MLLSQLNAAAQAQRRREAREALDRRLAEQGEGAGCLKTTAQVACGCGVYVMTGCGMCDNCQFDECMQTIGECAAGTWRFCSTCPCATVQATAAATGACLQATGPCLVFVAKDACWDGIMTACIWETLVKGCCYNGICLGCISPCVTGKWIQPLGQCLGATKTCIGETAVGCATTTCAAATCLGTNCLEGATCLGTNCLRVLKPEEWDACCGAMSTCIAGCVQTCAAGACAAGACCLDQCCIPCCQQFADCLKGCVNGCAEIPTWAKDTCLPATLDCCFNTPACCINTCVDIVGCCGGCQQCYDNCCSFEECQAGCVRCAGDFREWCTDFGRQLQDKGAYCLDASKVNLCIAPCANIDAGCMRTKIALGTTFPKRFWRTVGPAKDRQVTKLQIIGTTQSDKLQQNVECARKRLLKTTKCGPVMGMFSNLSEAQQQDYRDAHQEALNDAADTEQARLALWRGKTDPATGKKLIEGFNDASDTGKKEFWYKVCEDVAKGMQPWEARWQGAGATTRHPGYQPKSYEENLLGRAVREGRAIVPEGKPGYVPPAERYQQEALRGGVAQRTAAPRVAPVAPVAPTRWTCHAVMNDGSECGKENSVEFNFRRCGNPACRAAKPVDLAEPLLAEAAPAPVAYTSINQEGLRTEDGVGPDAGRGEYGADYAVSNTAGQQEIYERLKEYTRDQNDVARHEAAQR